MASEDLSDEEILLIAQTVMNDGDIGPIQGRALVREVRRRRAAELTDEEREGLRWLSRRVGKPPWNDEQKSVLAVLDKLLAAHGGCK